MATLKSDSTLQGECYLRQRDTIIKGPVRQDDVPGRTHLKAKLQALWGDVCHARAKRSNRQIHGRTWRASPGSAVVVGAADEDGWDAGHAAPRPSRLERRAGVLTPR